MAPRAGSSKLENRSARLRLARRKKPYSGPIMRGVQLLYRRNETAGPWMVRVCRDGKDWTERLGLADDYDEADGKNVLTYWQAQDLARERARVGKSTSDLASKAVVERYRADLKARGKETANTSRVLFHLEELPKLADMVVTASSFAGGLRDFRDQLAAKNLKPATIDRITAVFRAALNHAADGDERIMRRPWKTALKAIGSEGAGVNNVVLDDADRRTFRGAAYRDSDATGLLYDVLDQTGARSSQVARLTGEDVQADFIDPRTARRAPRIMVPTSNKGRGKRKARAIPVPITPELADRLMGRYGVLLKRADGVPWADVNIAEYFTRAVLKDVTFVNPARVTLYALRHSSIVRMLVGNVPIRIVAALHDTSVAMIERNYSKYIADHADELARATLPAPAAVVSLERRA